MPDIWVPSTCESEVSYLGNTRHSLLLGGIIPVKLHTLFRFYSGRIYLRRKIRSVLHAVIILHYFPARK